LRSSFNINESMKILIVDDHPIVLKGLSTILKSHNDTFQIIEAVSGKQAKEILNSTIIDIVILDLSLPDVSGLALLSQIKERYPNLKVIIQSVMNEDVYERKCFEAGASAFLKKEFACEELIYAVLSVINNKTYFSDKLLLNYNVCKSQIDIHNLLSKQEFQVLNYIGKGYKNKEIAFAMNVSEKTICTYKSRMINKLNIKTNELIRFCIESGIVE